MEAAPTSEIKTQNFSYRPAFHQMYLWLCVLVQYQHNINKISTQYQSIQCRFQPREAGKIVQETLKEQLEGKKYDQNETSAWTRDLATLIKTRLKGDIEHEI